ncbi:MAG: DinB family protein [Gemmatimonadota bacterium]|nr:DinB family protein [Gemmatimonadota bacterium]MDE3128501.1 DinB family protein [Gemmatimonadota bacterium]MDE3217007.1 DinB family protein [Gemmatimonadota bacterium]
MTTAELIGTILVRDLGGVRREIEAYRTDADLWKLDPAIPNSAGTLALHLAGNLRHYVGAVLGDSGYVRDRDAEFSARGVSRADLLRQLDAAAADITKVMPRIADAQLAATYPVPVAGRTVSTGDMLIHLAVHLTYHLGQIDYHRRLLGGSTKSIGAVSPAELRSATPAQ